MPLLEVKRHSSESFKKSVHYRTVNSWNNLPKELDYESEFQIENKSNAFKLYIFDFLVENRERDLSM